MNKTTGYILLGLGLISIVLSFEEMPSAIGLILPEFLSPTILTALGVILLLIGGFLSYKKSEGKQPEEVPIYEGKNIVGYRRHTKKR